MNNSARKESSNTFVYAVAPEIHHNPRIHSIIPTPLGYKAICVGGASCRTARCSYLHCGVNSAPVKIVTPVWCACGPCRSDDPRIPACGEADCIRNHWRTVREFVLWRSNAVNYSREICEEYGIY